MGFPGQITGLTPQPQQEWQDMWSDLEAHDMQKRFPGSFPAFSMTDTSISNSLVQSFNLYLFYY